MAAKPSICSIAHQPNICFLDVQMPGKTGVEAAQHIGRRAHLVFVTAFDEYAVQAFAQGALDYLVKPVEPARLAETVHRLQERLRAAQPALDTEALLQQLARALNRDSAPQALALGACVGRIHRAAHRGAGHRLPARRREVHADRVAR